MLKNCSLIACTAALMGCYQGGARPSVETNAGDDARADDGDDDGDDDGAASGEPSQDGEGDADAPSGRHIRRMTADQFHASLVTVTGQPWPAFEEYAAALGKADYARITREGRDFTITFDKFAHDAAMYSCPAAIAADLDGTSNPRVILRWAELDERDPTKIRRNLDYLVLRFLGQQMHQSDDPRVDPWMKLLLAAPHEGEIDDELMRERWTAVCAGLLTHPDFASY